MRVAAVLRCVHMVRVKRSAFGNCIGFADIPQPLDFHAIDQQRDAARPSRHVHGLAMLAVKAGSAIRYVFNDCIVFYVAWRRMVECA